MKIRSAAFSHQGLVRDNNEDRIHADNQRGIFLVVDGMGGHAAGEVAADIALKSIRGRLERQTDTVDRRVREAIALANNAIYEAAQSKPEWSGMACVLTVAVVENGNATIGHVGDSRLYKIRQGRMEKITRDHSPVGEREDRGEYTEDQAMKHPRRNEVYRDVGSEEHTPDDADFIEISTVPLETDSALLLCSDGLSDVVPSAEILRIIQEHAADPRAAVRELIESANRNSKDNVSAVLVEGESFAKKAGLAPAGNRAIWPCAAAAFLCGALLTYAALKYLEPPTPVPHKTTLVNAPESVAAAIAKSNAGDIVEMAPGEYHETVRLKEGVDLIAQKEREAILIGGVVAENVHHARVVGLRIRASDVGVAIKDSNVIVERAEITGARTAAIEFSEDSSGLVEASFLHDNAGAGIVVRDPAAPRIEYNVIRDNLRPGIEFLSSAQPVLIGNTVVDKK